MINDSDGVIISSPEYARAIPGGLKNAIDWLVSREEIISKPVALMHASHRGDDMLAQLRLVLSTVSQRFAEDIFLRFDLMKASPDEILRPARRLIRGGEPEEHRFRRPGSAMRSIPKHTPRSSSPTKAVVFGAPESVLLDLPQLTEDQPAHRPFRL